MPIFEYVCRGCGEEFETIVQGSTKPACPSCGGHRLDKRHSVFAAIGGNGREAEFDAPAACGTCGDPRGPGSCSLN